MCIYFTSHETQLEGDAMKLPTQLPVDVTVLKKIQVVDKATGRLTDYGMKSFPSLKIALAKLTFFFSIKELNLFSSINLMEL